jgi:hypothetical protein
MTDDSSEQHPEPVVVATYPDRGEAEVTKAHLAANGIEAFIVDEVEGGTLPVEGEAGVTVLVQGRDAEAARRALAPNDPR